MKNVLLIVLLGCFIYEGKAQVPTKFHFSGYKVYLLQDGETRIDFCETKAKCIEKYEDGVMHYIVADQTGRVPKDTIFIHFDELQYVYFHNCEIVCKDIISLNSLTVITASSFGQLKINADFVEMNIGAGSMLSIEGYSKETDYLIGAGSNVDSKHLMSEKGNVNVMGYSSLGASIKIVGTVELNKGTFKNYYEI